MDARRDAFEKVGGRYDVRVLEPSPPAVHDAPYYADDPVNAPPVGGGLPRLSPVGDEGLTWDALAREDPDLAPWIAERWLGAWERLPALPAAEVLASTRDAWHAVAEHVLSPARHAACGKIGLRYTRGGFGTPFFADDQQLRVEGVDLVVERGRTTRRDVLATVGDAARLAGIEPGAPAGVYEASNALDEAAVLHIDPRSAELLADWLGFAASVLEELRARADPGDDPARVQLWPEHFDLAVDLGPEGGRGTFGASLGDDEHEDPYLYVTHWSDVAPHAYWDDRAFDGASLPYSSLLEAQDQRATALAFFEQGRRVLRSASAV